VNPEACEAETLAGRARQLAVIEKVWAVADGLSLSRAHLVDVYPARVEKTWMEKLDLKGKPDAAPKCVAAIKADLTILVVGQFRKWIGEIGVLRLVRFARELAGNAAHRGAVERGARIAGRRLSRSRPGQPQSGERQVGAALQKVAAAHLSTAGLSKFHGN
jgi:hypothetical protein